MTSVETALHIAITNLYDLSSNNMVILYYIPYAVEVLEVIAKIHSKELSTLFNLSGYKINTE